MNVYFQDEYTSKHFFFYNLRQSKRWHCCLFLCLFHFVEFMYFVLRNCVCICICCVRVCVFELLFFSYWYCPYILIYIRYCIMYTLSYYPLLPFFKCYRYITVTDITHFLIVIILIMHYIIYLTYHIYVVISPSPPFS